MGLDKITNAVEVDGGVKQFAMRQIKQEAAPGRERLSAQLCQQIRTDLLQRGYGVLPHELPTREEESVHVYRRDGVVGRLVQCACAAALAGEAGKPTSVSTVLQRVPELEGLLALWSRADARDQISDVPAS